MAACNAHYYATRDPFGAAGDFVTAPEISQMFGELIGLWLADLWVRAGRPEPVRYVEFGPGRGTLAVDALRAMAAAGLRPSIELIETSPVLREAQAERLPGARWHDDLAGVPHDGALLVVTNEFFDALPVQQFVRTEGGWRERVVTHLDGKLAFIIGERDVETLIPPSLQSASTGSIVEASSSGHQLAHEFAARLSSQGGAALIVDYGYGGPMAGETLQAVSRHAHVDPLDHPGEHDLTAHVDFTALRAAAGGVRVAGPIAQGIFLDQLGIDARAAALKARNPNEAAAIEAAKARLTLPDAMGALFKAMALIAPAWPEAAGFPGT